MAKASPPVKIPNLRAEVYLVPRRHGCRCLEVEQVERDGSFYNIVVPGTSTVPSPRMFRPSTWRVAASRASNHFYDRGDMAKLLLSVAAW